MPQDRPKASMGSLILILHSRLDHRKRNLHMNWTTFVFKPLLNRRLNSHRCKAQQLLINELLNSGLKKITILNRIPNISGMISTYGIGIMLVMIGKPSRLDPFRHNFPNVNQYRQQICIRYRNWIIARMSPLLIINSFVDLFLLQIWIASGGPLMW